MDWRYITQAVNNAQTLDADQLRNFLTTLDETTPEMAAEIRRHAMNANLENAFMLTSIGQYLPPDTPQYKAGEIIGPWKLGTLIGSGGMGDVYTATRADGLYDQIVAIKIMKGQGAIRRQRFDEERQQLARLNHPSIAKIMDGGVSPNDSPYLVMEYAAGQPILDYADAKTLDKKARLRAFCEICHAVAHAHSRLILHRDLKSENILVDDTGQVKLVDLGIARLLTDETETYVPFSLNSASPEQLNGEALSVQSDIFSLGLLLHELLTGTAAERQFAGDVDIKSSTLSPDMQAILEKCLKLNPEMRYESVSELQADVTAHLTHHPVSARDGTGIYKFGKLLKRAPIASALAASVIAALSGGIIVSQHFSAKATKEAERANAQLVRAEYNAKESSLLVDIATSTTEAFLFAFGADDEKIEDLTNLLLSYETANLDETKAVNPRLSAIKTYALGRHFISRNDYLNARKILEPWVLEAYGDDPILLSYGRGNLGHAYIRLGEKEAALEMFKLSEIYFRETPKANQIDHAAMALEVAKLSNEVEDTDRALGIIDVMFAKGTTSFEKMYLSSKVYDLEVRQTRWDKAYTAIRETVDVIDSGRIGFFSSVDSVRLNLAQMELFYKEDFKAAQVQIDKAREIAENKKGNSIGEATMLQLEAAMQWSKGETDDAVRKLQNALPIINTYVGKTGHYAQAVAQLEIMKSEQGLVSENWSDLAFDPDNSWHQIAQLFILANSADIQSAQSYYDTQISDPGFGQKNIGQIYYLKQLENRGLKLSMP